MFRLFIRGRIEEISRIGSRALSKPPAAAMKIISPALQRHVHHGAAVVPKLCRKAVVLHFEFLDHFNRGFVINVAGRALSLFGCADQGAVNSYLSRGVSLAVRYKVCSGGVIVIRSRTGDFGDSTGKKSKPKEIAAGKWNFFNVLIGHFSPERRVPRIK